MGAINLQASAAVIIPIQQERPIFQESTGYLKHAWLVIYSTASSVTCSITSLFFITINFISPQLGLCLTALSGHVMNLWTNIKYNIMSGKLRGEIADLQSKNLDLKTRVDMFASQNRVLQNEKSQVIQERDQARGERHSLILTHAPVLTQRDRLLGEKQVLTHQLAELVQQRDEAVNSKEQIEGNYRDALGELGEVKAQLGRAEDHRELNQHLAHFSELYGQINENNGRGSTKAALEELIPAYKIHRERLHGMLRTSIDCLPPGDLSVIPLKGILGLSTDEMDHLEQISQALHLNEELRTSLTDFFQALPNPLKIAGR